MKKGPQLVGSSKRQQQFLDLQDDMNDHLENLSDTEILISGFDEPVEKGVNIADLFTLYIHFMKLDAGWQLNLNGAKIQTLRTVANVAAQFGLEELARIIRKHIALRQSSKRRAA